MNLHIFQTQDNETTTLLQHALEKRGHIVTKGKLTYFDITSPSHLDLSNIDMIYYWGGMGTFGRMNLLHYARSRNIPVVNGALLDDVYMLNKIGQVYKVSAHNITTPKTLIGIKLTFEDAAQQLGTPFIIKAALGSGGNKVFCVHNKDEFDTVARTSPGTEFLYQEYIPNDCDFRVHVIGGRAVCAYRRTPTRGNFRTNICQGGIMNKIDEAELLSELYITAEKVVASFEGAEIVGVDLMQHSITKKIYFIEINYIPGTGDDVTQATGVDLSEHMCDYFESVVTKKA